MNNFRGELTDISAKKEALLKIAGGVLQAVQQWSFFQKYIILFLDTLTQQTLFSMIKINIFLGDLSGISAKTAPLLCSDPELRSRHVQCFLFEN